MSQPEEGQKILEACTKTKILKELFNFEYFCDSKQSRLRKPAHLLHSNLHEWCVIHVESLS